MSVNKNQPHILVLPEDDANHRLANGFLLQVPWNRQRQMQVLTASGGWSRVLDCFRSDHVAEMKKNQNRFMVLLIDFDGNSERLTEAKARIPEMLGERVFILGALNNPEDLKAKLGPYEAIGSGLAKDCDKGTDEFWGHKLLKHNAGEVDRMRKLVRPILFGIN